MPRPETQDIAAGQSGWDGRINDNFDILTKAPMPPVAYADASELPAASGYVGCVAYLLDEERLVTSDGTNWVRHAAAGEIPAVMDHLADSTASDTAGLVDDFNALLAELQAKGYMAGPP
ncbi:MAG: hypothetical protein KIT58_00165 [Planctomycetota bacterium]|nr:hypothetical protein [Planctomycetota bacterium]